jgi:hypothetical protein
MRIVSLLAGTTEILYALGLGDSIAGVSSDCTFPPGVKSKPIASRSQLPANLSSAAIHEAAESLHRSGSVYHIDPAFLRAERPDLILAQDVCEVCAVTSEQARAAAEEALCSAAVLSISATSLAGILESIEALGRYTAEEEESARLRERMEEGLEKVRRTVADVEPVGTFYVGWLETLMCEGHWKLECLWQPDREFAPPHGESLQQVQERMLAAFQDAVRAHPGQTILMVSHTEALGALMCGLLGMSAANIRHFHLDPCGLSMVELRKDVPVLTLWNDAHHLGELSDG